MSAALTLPIRAMALAAMILLGAASPLAVAQIVAAPGSGAQVVQTQNGLQQVNIAKPSAAGVSVNNYSQFDVPGKGAILNNSPTIVQTQQAGYVNGNRIYLVSNEFGVGVSNKGVLAAQAGDLTLQSNGQLVLAGTTNASGSINASATQGIDNSGTTYAQHDVVATTGGALTNSGVLAAQNNTTINAGNVASTGTLGAGVNSDGTITCTPMAT